MEFITSVFTFLTYSTLVSLGITSLDLYTGRFLHKKTGVFRTLGYFTPGVNALFLISHSIESAQHFLPPKWMFLETKKPNPIQTLEKIHQLYVNPTGKRTQLSTLERFRTELKEELRNVFDETKRQLFGNSKKSEALSTAYFFTTVLPKNISELKAHPEDPYYRWLLVTHEDSFETILQTFQESIKTHQLIEPRLLSASEKILKTFSENLQKRQQELIDLEIQQKEDITKSLENNLSFELEYQQKVFPKDDPEPLEDPLSSDMNPNKQKKI